MQSFRIFHRKTQKTSINIYYNIVPKLIYIQGDSKVFMRFQKFMFILKVKIQKWDKLENIRVIVKLSNGKLQVFNMTPPLVAQRPAHINTVQLQIKISRPLNI